VINVEKIPIKVYLKQKDFNKSAWPIIIYTTTASGSEFARCRVKDIITRDFIFTSKTELAPDFNTDWDTLDFIYEIGLNNRKLLDGYIRNRDFISFNAVLREKVQELFPWFDGEA